jgi:hypothetical protein
MTRTAQRVAGEHREKVLGPHRKGVVAAKPRKRQIRFPKG